MNRLLAVVLLAVVAGSLSAGSALADKPAPPELVFDPASHDYGQAWPGTGVSAQFTLSFSGQGNSGRLETATAGSAFSITADTCSGVALSARQTSCTITVRYAPANPGEFDGGAVIAVGKSMIASIALSGRSTPCTGLGDDFSGGVPAIDLQGWFRQNNSDPEHLSDWFLGNTDPYYGFAFTDQAGTGLYIAADRYNTAHAGTISNWLVTPPLMLLDGATISFSTRSNSHEWQDRLQVRFSASDSTDVGTTPTSVGAFTSPLLDINESFNDEYPVDYWRPYTLTLDGIGAPTLGRIAFRYYVPDGGTEGIHSEYIGIDNIQYTCPS